MSAAQNQSQVVEIRDVDEWNSLVESLSGHPMQHWGWGQLKQGLGTWTVSRQAVYVDGRLAGAAQVLLRKLPFPLRSMAYVPRGPMVAEGFDAAQIASSVAEATRQTGAVCVLFEPGMGASECFAPKSGVPAATSVLLSTTLILDLSKSREELLAAMSKKTRQYIRKSEREGVTVRALGSEDIPRCLAIYDETASRAGFPIHDRSYYDSVAAELGDASRLYGAFVDEELHAFLWLASTSDIAFELYGGVTSVGQRARANYALKWHAILAEKDQGVRRYDLNGLLNDGISEFKKGFASHQTQLAGPVDVPLRPVGYALWARAMPAFSRARGKYRELAARRG